MMPITPTDTQNLDSRAKIGLATSGLTFVPFPPQKSRGVRVGVPSRGLCFLGNHDLKHAVVFGSAFLAGAFVFWEKHDLKKAVVFGSAFLAGALVFWKNVT